MENKKAVISNTFWQVIIRLVMLAVTLISIKLLTIYLGPSATGEYNTITTYINFFIVLADMGLFAVTVREISKTPDREGKILSNVFVIRLISALLACVFSIAIVYFTHYSSHIKLGVLIGSGFLFFNLLSSVYDMALQYRLKMQYSALSELFGKVISVIALYLITTHHGSFYWVMGTVALWGVLIFIFKWLFAAKFLKLSFKYDKDVASWILRLSWPLGIVFIVNNLYFKIDTMILFALKGAAATGIYTVAYKILEVTAFIGSYFASALKPQISKNIKSNPASVGITIQKSITIMILCVMPIVVTSLAFSKDIIYFLSSPEFFDSSRVLILLALTLPFIYLDVVLVEVFIANDSRATLLKISSFVLIFNLLLNFFLIPRYSYYGAASATLISEIVLLMINVYLTKKIIPYSVEWSAMLKIALSGLIAYCVALVLAGWHLHFIISAVISVLVYILMLLWLKIVSSSMLKSLMASES